MPKAGYPWKRSEKRVFIPYRRQPTLFFNFGAGMIGSDNLIRDYSLLPWCLGQGQE